MIRSSALDLARDDSARVRGFPPIEDAVSHRSDVEPAVVTDEDSVAEAETGLRTADELDATLDEHMRIWQKIALYGVDVGVASTVLALAAAGCATLSRCRRYHAGHHSGAAVREVVSWASQERARLVRELADTVGGASPVDEEGRAPVFAPSASDMLALARELLALNSVFATIGPVPDR